MKTDLTLTAEQKKLAEEFDKNQKNMVKEQKRVENLKAVIDAESEAIARFLKDKVKTRSTLLMQKMETAKSVGERDITIEYFLGKSL